MRLNAVVIIFSLVALASDSVCGFSVANRNSVPRSLVVRSMSSEDREEPTAVVKSVLNKEIAYDEKSGRFFETNTDDQCIPDEEFCMIDKETGQAIRLTVEEKERIFLDQLQSYFTSERAILSEEEFQMLREDLSWNGSDMVGMSDKELKYVTAVQQSLKGTPIMSDAEYDSLKKELIEEGSKFAVQTEPKCYVDTGICKVTLQRDGFRSNLLYLPAGSALMILWLFFGFELIEPIIRLNPIILAAIGLPWITTGAKAITENILFRNFFIAYGPCPNCSFENRVFFGDILGVEGFTDLAEVKCPNCKEEFTVQRATLRASTLSKA